MKIDSQTTIGNCTLYLGDCADVLPAIGGVDAIVTDPPYGISKDGQKESTGKHGGRKAYDFLKWDMSRPDKKIFDLIREVSTYQIIWGGNYFADYLPAKQKWLVWNKEQRINQSDGEFAYTSLDGALRIFDMNRVRLRVDGAEHPTQKPIELMKWCIAQLPDDCETICDPFMGSGTTGVAAVKMGKKFIGIEREPQYYEIACRRIAQAVSQPDMFMVSA